VTAAAGAGVGPALDLLDHPFTQPESRLVLRRTAPGAPLAMATAEYERRIADCSVLRSLVLLDEAGGEVRGVAGAPDSVRWPGGAFLVAADAATLSLRLPAGWSVRLGLTAQPTSTADGGWAATMTAGQDVAWRIEGPGSVARLGGGRRDDGSAATAVLVAGPAAPARVLVSVGPAEDGPAAAMPAHEDLAARSAAWWVSWFARRPAVRPDLAPSADLAWWTLAANRVRLTHPGAATGSWPPVVVPSKLGYVASWQWDTYFIAVGLRHGAPELAWEQLAFVLDRALPDGQLPDVVSDAGAIYRVGDLPPGEIGRDPADTRITKPPLAAWAVWLVHETLGDRDRLAWALPRLERLQRWWAQQSDRDGDGLSEYGHRFSSGLDDSPLFDHGVPAETPDLNTYLAVADDRMGRIARRLGMSAAAAAHDAAAEERVARLAARRWDEGRGRFRTIADGQDVDVLTPFALMPLLTGRLAPSMVDRLVDTLTEPGRLWTPWPLATVAADEPTFDPGRMWRGPVWLNVNRLIVEGLQASGRPEVAAELAERSLALVTSSGGPYEHWDPRTGRPAASATSMFSWSAALFLDLAVAASGSVLS
jgi:glycogen debranching enzyme